MKRTLAVFLTVFVTGAATAQGAETPYVDCLNDQETRYFWRIKPASCNVHQKGEPVAGYSTFSLRQMRWGHWGDQWARGRGKTVLNMYGYAPVRVWLSQPQRICGRRVFSKIRGVIRTRERGQVRRHRFSMRITTCVR